MLYNYLTIFSELQKGGLPCSDALIGISGLGFRSVWLSVRCFLRMLFWRARVRRGAGPVPPEEASPQSPCCGCQWQSLLGSALDRKITYI